MSEKIIGVVGAGTMGQGIAQIASTYNHEVYLYDAYSEQLGKAKHALRKILQRQVEKDRMSQNKVDGIIDRVHFVEDLTDYKKCNLVIEAVVEDLEAKLLVEDFRSLKILYSEAD